MTTTPTTIDTPVGPAAWEQGGGMTNTGDAVVIAGPNGERLTPLEVRTPGHLSNGQHALLPLTEGCWAIVCERCAGREVVTLSRWLGGEWVHQAASNEPGFLDIEDPGQLGDAIAMAQAKAADYHCRQALYVK